MGGALRRLIVCGFLLFSGGFSPVASNVVHAATATPKVVVLSIDGVINPATSDFLIRGLAHAAQEHAALAVIELDTPGGLDTSMRAIIKQILASPVPVATFVSPGGARAASAGTFILYASHIAAMTPASNVGAASPVSIGLPGFEKPVSEPADKAPASVEPGQAQSGSAKPPVARQPPAAGPGDDTMNRKITNDAIAYIHSLAQLRGRNSKFAEQAVRDAASLSAHDALAAGAIDLIADNLDDLLAKLNGRQVALASGITVRLATAGANIERIVPDWRSQILAKLAHPEVAVILLMAGIFGLFFELTNPGMALPGVAGAICLLLGLYAFQLLPVNWAGVALLGVGTMLMIAEAFLPTFGVVGLGGLVAFFLGGLFLMDSGASGLGLSIPFLIGIALASAVLLFAVGAMAARAHKRQVVTGREEMLGLPGVVTLAGDHASYADVRGESWRIQCREPLAVGDPIKVTALEGLTLHVVRQPLKK